MEPRKSIIPGADDVLRSEGNTDGHVSASARETWRGRRPWHVRTLLAREPGDLQSDPLTGTRVEGQGEAPESADRSFKASGNLASRVPSALNTGAWQAVSARKRRGA